ncbi:hypothetical protein FQN57_001835 [Myotisia sp. PD_48]|nr:hypothetical protein FQN57_001835 [Myotisia sp. PD_48]
MAYVQENIIYRLKNYTGNMVGFDINALQPNFSSGPLTRIGPVIRITPDEVHLSDPQNYDLIYHNGSKNSKSAAFYDAFGTDHATFTTADNSIHRIKRGALNPMFSRKRVLELENVVQSRAKQLERRISSALKTQGGIDLHHGFRAISVDVITDYAFDNCYDFLEQDDFGVGFFDMIRDFGFMFWLFQQVPSIRPLALATPFWLAKLTSKPLTRMMMLHQVRVLAYLQNILKVSERSSRVQINRVKASLDREEKPRRPTIFHQLLDPEFMKGEQVPTVEQLKDEAYIIVAAAADTTGNAMTIAAYNVVTNPEIYKRLTQELVQAFPNPDAEMDFLTLEKLPYLTGVIKEGLRLSFGVIGRLPRVIYDPARCNGYTIPAGSIVSMSSWIQHRNEDLFPDSEKFSPSRWLDRESSNHLEHYLVAFGKGSRQCVGMQLAYCELYVTLARVFRHFPNLTIKPKQPEELLYMDQFSSYHPEKYNQFYFQLDRSA